MHTYTHTRTHARAQAATKDIGPGSYEAPGLAASLQKQVASRAGADAAGSVFGSTSKRFNKLANPAPTPGPGEYNQELPSDNPPSKVPSHNHAAKGNILGRDVAKQSSVFLSESKRFDDAKETKKKQKELPPPPGAYDTSIRWDQAKGVASLGAGVKSRFEPARSETNAAIGPGAYSIKSSIVPMKGQNRRNVMMTSEPRFPSKKSTSVPGPGSYDTQLMYGNLLKQTYNVAIAEQSADIF